MNGGGRDDVCVLHCSARLRARAQGRINLKRRLEAFRDDTGSAEMSFPPGLTIDERAYLHQV